MVQSNAIYKYIHKQIPIIILLSLFPGLGYIFLGWLNDIYMAALIWYLCIVMNSVWGYVLYKSFEISNISEARLSAWYKQTSYFYYLFYLLWCGIFLLYAREVNSGMHYIAVFTQIGASTVAAAMLFPDKKLYRPTIFILIVPLIIYFALVATWYGYVLAFFASVFGWVLLYAATSSHELFKKTIRQATHDYLTGLYNRQHLIESLQKKMNTLKEQSEYSYLLLLDLDHFKSVNDSLGHDVGDELLREVVKRIQTFMSGQHMLARLGGDEFIITGENFKDRDVCEKMATILSDDLLRRLKDTFVIHEHHLYISASIGVSLIHATGNNAVDFIKEADIAMYEAKARGRDGVYFFDESMSKRVEYNLQLEQLLHSAVEKNQIELVYQPQIDLENHIVGVEALVRWLTDTIGTLQPKDFIPVAENTGLIIELGRHIVRQAFIALADWDAKNIQFAKMSINISMRQFTHFNFVSDMRNLCDEYLSDRLIRKITFEITESVAAEDIKKVIAIIQELKTWGIRFSMDDFGTGYSSLSYLQKIPIDEIKIDRIFIKELAHQVSAEEMIDTILGMARIFNFDVVAEGVEEKEQLEFLHDHGCCVFQGFYLSHPLSRQAFEDYYWSKQAG